MPWKWYILLQKVFSEGIRLVQRDHASQVALSSQLNQGHKPFPASPCSRLHFTLLPGFTSVSKTNLHLQVCYSE